MTETTHPVPVCLVCGLALDCGHCRGLCCYHYHKLAGMVRRKKTTWAELVRAGKAKECMHRENQR